MPGTYQSHESCCTMPEIMQEAEAAGYTNFFEITARESLDQVRVVFNEGIRRGLTSGEHRSGSVLDELGNKLLCSGEDIAGGCGDPSLQSRT